jgi:hypothetical protein
MLKADVADNGDGISKELKKAFLHFVSAILVSFQENCRIKSQANDHSYWQKK